MYLINSQSTTQKCCYKISMQK